MVLREFINIIETIKKTSDKLVIFATKKEDKWDLDASADLVLCSDMENI